MNAEEFIITSIEKDLSSLDSTYDRATALRDKAIEKLSAAVDTLDLTVGVAPREREVQLALVNTYLSAVADTEKSITKRVEAKLKRRDTENNADAKEFVSAMLAACAGKPEFPVDKTPIHKYTLEDVEAQAEALFNTMDMTIADTELRTDNTDLS